MATWVCFLGAGLQVVIQTVTLVSSVSSLIVSLVRSVVQLTLPYLGYISLHYIMSQQCYSSQLCGYLQTLRKEAGFSCFCV